MTVVPFALSVHKFIDSIGADAGFAAIVGLALMTLLYFAQARESASLRDELDDAANRIASVEGRLTQVVRTQVARQDADANVPPAIIPAPAFAGARSPAVPAAAAVSSRTAGGVPFIGAPAGQGAPALASATRAIPFGPAGVPVSPAVAPAGAPTVPSSVPVGPELVPAVVPIGAPATASGAQKPLVAAGVAQTLGVPDDTMFATATATAPPRVDFLDDEPSGPPRRMVPPPPGRGPSRARGRHILQALAGAVVVVVLVIVLLTASGGNPKAPKAPVRKHHHHKVVSFNPAHVNVAVLNGTAINGLAAEVGATLAGQHYNVPQGTITNAATQTQTTTEVGYQAGDKYDAQKVAKALGLPSTDVALASTSAVQSCAAAGSATNGATGATTTGICSAQVIVTIGTDLAAADGDGNATG